MNTIERIKMVKAMEFIARHVNDEDVFEAWLIGGVADGDLEFGDLDASPEDIDNLEVYIEDISFADLMHTFLRLMKSASKSGGLSCDRIIDKEE